MSGGGKGGTETSQVKIPPSLELYAKDVMNMSMNAAQQPFTPNQGAQVAQFTPQQMSAIQGANSGAAAFGLPSSTNEQIAGSLPNNTLGVNAHGIDAYSTQPLYEGALDASTTQEFRDARAQLYTNQQTGATAKPQVSPMFNPLYGGSDYSKPLALGPDPRDAGGGGK